MRGIEQFLQVDAATLGALKYAGTWNASTNTPTLASGVGVQGQYYVVSVAGSTNLDGETNWQVGDWAVFNGSVWQKVDGGSTGLLTTLTVTGNTFLATTSGNVGIGTSSPVNTAGYGGLTLNGTSGAIVSMMENGTETFRLINATGYSFVNTTGSTPLLFGTAATERMRIDASGNVGIGTNSPSTYGKLVVWGGNAFIQSTTAGVGSKITLSDTNNSVSIESSPVGGATDMVFKTSALTRMNLDNAGNLGLGVTPSAWSGGGGQLQLSNGNTVTFSGNTGTLGTNGYYNAGWKYITSSYAAQYLQINGQHQWFTAPSGTAGNAISFTQAMTLTAAGSLGVGILSPNYTFETAFDAAVIAGSCTALLSAEGGTAASVGAVTNHALLFKTNNTERMRLDASGNLGLGVTPSAWGFSGNLELPATNNIAFQGSYGNISSNAYYDLSQTRWEYITSGHAAQYQIGSAGQHIWFTAPSGTAGNAISFTQAMTLDASGNLLVGTTSADGRVTVVDSYALLTLSSTTGSKRIAIGSDAFTDAFVGTTTNHAFSFIANGSIVAKATASSSFVVGTAALATTATDGFIYVPTCAGTPTGTPTTQTGTAPIVIDTTNNKLYFYSGGQWRDAGP